MLTNGQIEDLLELHAVAKRFSADLVIIGAAALRCFVDLGRFTFDVDLVVALDLETFGKFSSELKALGWSQERIREHRWRGPKRSIIDLLPAGPKLRAANRIVWPDSQFEMSLAGFEHVFTRSIPFAFAPDIHFRVVPPPVIAILKIVAYAENQKAREKDLTDLKSLLQRYEASSDRIFGDDVFAAELEDIEYANAFLLGLDVGAITTPADTRIVRGFLVSQQLLPVEIAELDWDDFAQREILRFQMRLQAFERGLEVGDRK